MVTRRRLLGSSASLGVALTLGSGGIARVAAQDATPADGPPLPAGAVVVAEGLINPRYIAFAEDSGFHVSEAGTGGDEDLFMPSPTPESGTPEAAEPIGNRGNTGQVTKIAPAGTATLLVSGLPSYNVEEAVGPAGNALSGDLIWLAIGGAGPGTAFLDALPYENGVVTIDPATGVLTQVADIGAYERANNPHSATIDSNLYGLAPSGDGKVYVADAGSNTIYGINPASSELTVKAVIEDLSTAVDGTPAANLPQTLQAVPTGVAANPAGGLYVGLLTGGPFPPGAAKVISVADDGTIADVATGLTMVVDVVVGPDGQLYPSQISTSFLAEVPAPGAVVRVLPNGTNEMVVEGLVL